MSLSSALSIAQSALANNAAQSALLSRNIANVSNPNYNLRTAGSITQLQGSVATGPTQRATDSALLSSLLSAQSDSTSSSALNDGLTQIASSLGLDDTSDTSSTTATDQSPATLIGALSNALQQYAAQPDNSAMATAAVSAAKSLATGLNQQSANVQTVRAQADSQIASSVSTINSLLAQFKTVNDAVVAGTNAGTDVSDALDTRDGILKQLSNEIGITTVQGSGNSLSIYTDSGVTLFNNTPRTVSFTPTTAFTAGTVGQAVTVDGVAVTGASSAMPLQSGRIAGLATLRDSTAVDYQNQLDQIAAGLVSAFSETDQSGGSAPAAAGLFTSASLGTTTTGGVTTTNLPTASTTTGLAASLTINARVDPSAGGDPTRLRDGNIAGSSAAYTYNTSGAAAYSDRLQGLVTAMGQTQSFDGSSGGASSGTLASYAQSSVSWIEAARQTASSNASYQSTLVSTTTTALSNATGVNLDDQMSNMLDIEHAYQASAQLMNAVNTMYSSLLQSFN